MKSSRILFCLSLAVALLASCKEKETIPDTTPAVLQSFSFNVADNSTLDKDYAAAEIAEEMIIRIPEGGKGKTLVATLTAGENDQIKVNDKAVVDGKASVDCTYPIDIVVTNSKSGLSASYVVKVGKILGTVARKIGEYYEPDAELGMGTELSMAVSPVDGMPYLAYLRKATVDGTTEKYNNVSVVKWNGSSFDAVGKLGLADNSSRAVASPIVITFDKDNAPNVLYKGGQVANLMSVQKFSGSAWEMVGSSEGITTKFTVAYGIPQFYKNPSTKELGFFYTNNVGKTDPNYRNHTNIEFNGSEWVNTYSVLPGLPTYAAKGGVDGMFYRAAATNTKDAAWVAVSVNEYGYYIYKNTGSGWEIVVEGFCPEGETFGIPTNLGIKADKDDNIYVLAASSKEAKMQLYKLDEAGKTLTPYADILSVTAGSYGSVTEQMSFGINPVSGQIVGVLENAEGLPQFSFIGSNLRWEAFTLMGEANTVKTEYCIDFAADGTGYISYISQFKDADSQTHNVIQLYKIGLEDDILPE